MIRMLLVLAVLSLALESQAVVLDSSLRQVGFTGGLEQPDTMGGSASSTIIGAFDQSFADTLLSPGEAEAGAGVSQLSTLEIEDGVLLIEMTSSADAFASSLADGAIADSASWSELSVVFTTVEDALFTVDLSVSSSLGVYFDGPGAGVVEASYLGSILICVVDGACLADILVDDVTDNGLAVSDGVVDSVWLPAGQYSIQLLAVAQTISRDIGSAAGSAAFSGEVSVRPLPEPSVSAGLGLGAGLLAMLANARRRSC